MFNKSVFNTFFYFTALILNIFLGWLLTRINTNYLEVSLYGQYVFFISFISLGRSFFSIGFFESTSRLLAIDENVKEERRLFGTSLLWSILFAVVSTVILYFAGHIADMVFQVKIGSLCKDFAFGIGLFVLLAHLSLSMRGSGRIKMLSFITISPRIIYLLLLQLVILYGHFTLNITLQMMFISILLIIVGVWLSLKPSFENLREKTAQIWKEVKSYGRHIYISTIWTNVLTHADKLLISYFLNDQAMAYYGLGFALAFPLSHFSTSLATTLYQRFARTDRIGRKVVLSNIAVVSLSVSLFIFLREPIILFLFSAQYTPTIEILPPLALAFGFSGLSKPFTLFFMAQKQGKLVRNIAIVIPLIQILVNIYVIPIYGILGTAWVASIIYALDLILYIYFYLKLYSFAPRLRI